ncbi:proteasome-type protease [Pectobacterium quasiaquaticum]|uniref:Proteasome-type protease n=1 Tax=Pectobacterium quasiaquaticum TaxID=2774015 RepID=A0A9Q2I8T5_9GAMM|nr:MULTISPECIES: proteasome-type protease [Pectobacterium]MBE5203321.1 proteasome-type protease [Pectobacterium quasiaquaticum]MBE5208741.1 proteasome-type protease [Pectobacterium quasiaquaticum]MBE5215248.1 proteasome-type protease [Pectobacterium quasiaquaticum]MBE5221151.1 proteasome-type protease [Pectobacterium quasiaquaticum]MBE5225082.1 proteasome-type protease [Pectobacterium quasiaquaticum]
MTYCVAMCLSDGLVFASDSRTNAGVDHIATFKKLYVFQHENERVLVIQCAGNLATTQSIISLLNARIDAQHTPNLMQVNSMYDAAMLLGETVREVIHRDSSAQQSGSNTNFGCNLLLGGQIGSETHRLFHIYPEGNFIEATPDTPYFQIGESKYGKPIIDRVLTMDTPLEQAMCCALISIDSTLRSNLSVGLPLDVMIYRTGSFDSSEQQRVTENNAYFNTIRKAWSEGLVNTFRQLPPFPDSQQ